MKSHVRVLSVLCIVFMSVSVWSAQIADTCDVQIVARHGGGMLAKANGQQILYVSGSHYEMGFQHGKLLKSQVKAVCDKVLKIAFYAEFFKNVLPGPNRIEQAYRRLEPFIPERFQEELRGLADGSEVPLKRLQLANIFPALFHCSGFAIWGEATQNETLLHGRVLDYMTDAGLQKYALVTIAEPNGYHGFVNVGYAGFIGSVTGMNDRQVAIGEMGGGGVGDWDGVPMAYLFRMALEQADTLDEAVAVFREHRRTCEYYYVISDGKIPDARALECRPDEFTVIEPNQSYPKLPVAVNDAVLLSEDQRYHILAQRVVKDYGQFDAAAAIDLMDRPVAMRGNLHNCLFAPQQLELWVANAADPGQTPDYQACKQTYYHYDMKRLLDVFHAQAAAQQ